MAPERERKFKWNVDDIMSCESIRMVLFIMHTYLAKKPFSTFTTTREDLKKKLVKLREVDFPIIIHFLVG